MAQAKNRTAWVFGAVALGVVLYATMARGGDVDGPKAKAMVEAGALLLDVRTPEEFANAHLPGAVNVPVQQLLERLSELPSDKARPIVVYCRSGARSAKATKIIKDAGHTHVADLGAMSNWP